MLLTPKQIKVASRLSRDLKGIINSVFGIVESENALRNQLKLQKEERKHFLSS